MPGVERLSISAAVAEAREAQALGIGAVMLFGVPAEKDEQGSGAWDEEGVVQVATRAIKQALPELLVVTDVCLCEYTLHGHCGVLRMDGETPVVDNDATVELLARTAVSHARAGADLVAPSDMMDGRVGAIREELDGEGFSEIPILAYSAKFASAFYGPFREAAGSTPAFGDRRGYQLDPANGREAVREALLDVQEGADMVMVKPALAYGDLISAVKQRHRPAAGRLQRERRVRDGQGGRWPPATWTSVRPCSRSSPRCTARARTRSSPTTPRTRPDGWRRTRDDPRGRMSSARATLPERSAAARTAPRWRSTISTAGCST